MYNFCELKAASIDHLSSYVFQLIVLFVCQQEYLYRAALSELRTELSVRTKNESAALQQSAAMIHKDVEALSARMKEDVATMKHEYVHSRR